MESRKATCTNAPEYSTLTLNNVSKTDDYEETSMTELCLSIPVAQCL
jgi:hypothetical protein